jgi:site-specific recombinase XerC
MTGPLPAVRMRRLPRMDWPAADAAAWTAASNPRPGPFSRNRRRSPATYRMYAEAYGGFLWHLQSQDQLEPAETPTERVTPARLDHYYERLVQSGCADYTLVTRFEALHGALRLMYPDRDFSFITQPGGVSIRQRLHMNRRERFVPDSRHAELWAHTLFRAALSLPDPARRQRQVRDAALIGIMASRGPRLRAGTGMRLRHVRRVGAYWHLYFDAGLMKGGRSSLELPLSARVAAIVARYLAVERQELLRGETHDFVWVAQGGAPLSEKGIDFMMRNRTKAQYGVAFGAHRFRAGLTTTQALVDGKNLLGTARILAHSPAVALKHYNRAGALEASRRHAAYIDEAEDAAARMLGQRPANRHEQEKAVGSLSDLPRRHKRPQGGTSG